MKGNVFCLSNISLDNVYMIGSTAFPLETLLKEINDKNIITDYKTEYTVESYNILSKERTIRKLLKDYKYEKKKRFFKINLDVILKIFKDLEAIEEEERDTLKINKENNMINHCIIFINETLEPLKNINNETLEPDDSRSIKIHSLYEIYINWCRKEKIIPSERAGICNFEKICEKHTFLGKLSDYYEFNFVKIKI